MLDNEPTTTPATEAGPTNDGEAPAAPRRRRRAAVRPAGPPAPTTDAAAAGDPRSATAHPGVAEPVAAEPVAAGSAAAEPVPAKKVAAKRTRKRATKASATAEAVGDGVTDEGLGEPLAAMTAAAAQLPDEDDATAAVGATAADADGGDAAAAVDAPPARTRRRAAPPVVLFQPPTPSPARDEDDGDGQPSAVTSTSSAADDDEDDESGEGGSRRRRRGGRGRRGKARDTEATSGDDATEGSTDADPGADVPSGGGGPNAEDDDESAEGTTRRRRRRRRRSGGEDAAEGEDTGGEDAVVVVTKVREPRSRSRSRDKSSEEDDDGVRAIKGSTRLEAKKQRRREGREAGRRRPPVLTEAEFLARREAVDRSMLVRQIGDRTQIAVLEDGVLVEHYVSTAANAGFVGNVYLGRVQNVLPSMEAAFVDIGRGRNGVLYAGEVNWDAAGLEGQPRRIESALKSGDPVLVQVTKDPIGHKGARLTSQVSLAGRYLVLVPNGSMTGISRKLPENERARLKAILKKVVPEGAGVIVRTAAEGASEDELARDVARLTAQWEVIEKKSAKGSTAPALLYGEPDMTIRVVRDIFNEDFTSLIVSGDDAWDMLEPYISYVAPDLRERMSRWTAEGDVFAEHRVDEQLTKALDRKVWLPSGGYLVIDRTEAMIVVDVNTGKFTGAGGNLEETVTKNNLEAAEEIVRQLRLRDLGGIIVVDFIDMVLESNRDLVLRRLLECLGRDRTKHQVAEVTSLGLVQMTRKRVGQGLHEAFSTPCDCCNGRGYHLSTEPVEQAAGKEQPRGRSGRGSGADKPAKPAKPAKPGRRAAKEEADVGPESPESPDTAAEVDTTSDSAATVDPVAAEDPVEPPAAKAPRRRRRAAVSPQTTLP